MTILVTGGAGYVGSTLVDVLSRHGKHIRSIDNYSRGAYENVRQLDEREHVEFIDGDIRRKTDVTKAMDGVHTVVHLAALPGLELCSKHPKEAITTNIYGTWALVEGAVHSDVERFIFASSAAVYGIPNEFPIRESEPVTPINLYGVTKATGERIMNLMHSSEGLSTVILRFANIYGVGWFTHWQTVIPKFVKLGVRRKPLTVYGSGNQSRDFIHVTDVVSGILHVLEGSEQEVSGKTFNLGHGKAVSVNRVAQLVQQKLLDLADIHVDIVHTAKREGEPYLPNFQFSIQKIKDALGFAPEVDLTEGIEELIQERLG